MFRGDELWGHRIPRVVDLSVLLVHEHTVGDTSLSLFFPAFSNFNS